MTPSSGQFFRLAYIPIVMEVHAPNAESNRSYGVGPELVPPAAAGSSAVRRCEPATISCAKLTALPRTTTFGSRIDGCDEICCDTFMQPSEALRGARDSRRLRRIRIEFAGMPDLNSLFLPIRGHHPCLFGPRLLFNHPTGDASAGVP